jgi:hypothetical protein
MQISPRGAFAAILTPLYRIEHPQLAAELAYETVTILAIMLVLCSLWAF